MVHEHFWMWWNRWLRYCRVCYVAEPVPEEDRRPEERMV